MRKLWIILAAVALFYVIASYRKAVRFMHKPTIIFLNGVSSAGKSSIAKALQKQLDEPYLHLGIDTFFAMLPLEYVELNPKADQGIQFVQEFDQEGKPVVHIKKGPYAKKLYAGMHKAVKALADTGNNLIIDEVLLSKEDLQSYQYALRDHNVLWVKVWAPLVVLEERERERGDRVLGLARGLYDVVHKYVTHYDLEINSAEMMPQEVAEKIIAKMQERLSS